MTLFEQCKELVSIEQVAERYGIEIKRGKALCCFHDDTHPSITFKNGYYRCWVCNEFGDAISLVAKLNNINNYAALKLLNSDFNLGLDIENPSYSYTSQIIKKKNINNFQKQWLNKQFNQLCEKRKRIHSFISTHKAINESQAMELAKLQGELVKLDYYLDILTFGTKEEKQHYYESR